MRESLIYEGDYCRMWQYPQDCMIEVRFKPESTHMQDVEFRDTMQNLVDKCRETQSRAILINNEHYYHTISPGLQSWMHQEIYPRLAEMGVKRQAVLQGEDMFARVSMEQTVEDNPVTNTLFQLFESEKEALEWLLKKEPGR